MSAYAINEKVTSFPNFDEVETLVPSEVEAIIAQSDVEIQVLSHSHFSDRKFQNTKLRRFKAVSEKKDSATDADALRFYILSIGLLGLAIFGGASFYLSNDNNSFTPSAEPASFQPLSSAGEAAGYSFDIAEGQDEGNIDCSLDAQSALQKQIIKNATAVINATGLKQLNVSCYKVDRNHSKPSIAVTGYVDDRQYWMKVKNSLLHNEPSLDIIVDHVASPAVRKMQFDDWVEKAGLHDNIKSYLSNQGLVVQLNMSELRLDLWNEISDRYVRQFGNTPALYVMKDPRHVLQIKRVILGDQPQIMTKDGKMFGVGEQLDSEFLILSISKNGVKLKDQERQYTYNFNENLLMVSK